MKLLITGASGFIGSNLIKMLSPSKHELVIAVRKYIHEIPNDVEQFVFQDMAVLTINWAEALEGVDVVVHLAARAHISGDSSNNSLESFRLSNTTFTLDLAKQAARSGVKRFVFMSSIAVNGIQTEDKPFLPEDSPAPVTDYGVSKHEAESGLFNIASHESMEVVVIRPPMVYGSGAPGNFEKLLNILDKGLPLPFLLINNKRSFIALENLLSFIILCITHKAAANQVFLVSDNEDMSTKEFIFKLGEASNKSAMLFPVPKVLLKIILIMLGKKAMFVQLCESLQIDNTKSQSLLSWSPVITIEEAFAKISQKD